MEKPNIQIDDEVREMTDDEYDKYLSWRDETPTSMEDFIK